MTAHRILTLILRLDAFVLTFALFAVVMPVDWMIASHATLGMGEFPNTPLTLYLIRSLSALYFLRGALVWLVSTDVDRYLPIIALLAAGNMFFGIVALVVDLRVGMPWFWTLGEGPPLIALGCGILLLARHRSRQLRAAD